MAKKKYNNVTIKDEELVPTTIGVYDNKLKNPIGIFLLIIAFVAIVFYMPQIQTYVNKFLGKTEDVSNSSNNQNNNNNNDNTNPGDDNDDTDEITKYNISSDLVIETDKYLINGVKLENNVLSLNFQNKSSSKIDLDVYYAELYSSENTLLERVKLGEDNILSQGLNSYTYTINSNPSLISIVTKTENDYPNVNLKTDENGQGVLKCTLGNESYDYYFTNNLLGRVTYTITRNNDGSVSYFDDSKKYFELNTSYNGLDGINALYTPTANGFSFTMNVDLSKSDLSIIKNKNIFDFQTSPKEVKFKQEARAYKCE